MGTIFRPPLTLKVEPKDPRGVATRAQTDVDPGNDLLLELRGKDTQFAGPGQWKTYDWPNPRGPQQPITNKTWTDSFKLPLTTHKAPYQEKNWPVPATPRRSINLWSHTYLALALTAVTAAPFSETEWPVPRGDQPLNVGFVAGTPYALTVPPEEPVTNLGAASESGWPTFTRVSQYKASYGTPICLTVVVTQAPFRQTDWPNPTGAQFSNFLRRSGVTNNINLGLPGAPQLGNVGDTVRGPTFKRTVLYDSGAQQQPVIILVAGAPFVAKDWPNPRGPKRHQDFVLGSPYALTAVVQAPFNQDEWRIPRAPRRPVKTFDDTAWNFPLTLTAVQPPFFQEDWPNPRGSPPRQYWTDSFKLPLQTIEPLNQYDWPNPRGPQPLNRGFESYFDLSLQTIVGSNQYNWPNPTPPRRNEQLGWTSAGLGLTTVVVYPATITFDWPNPRGPQQYNRGISDSFKLPLQTIEPSNQYDWPVPRGAKPVVADWIYGTPYSLASAVAAPFFETEWPNPRGAKSKVADWTDSFKLPLQTIEPANQYDWPVPRGAKPKVADWQHSFDLPLTTVRGTAQYDWPVPKGGRRNEQLGWTNPGLGLTTVVVYPATITFDYPNPTLRVATPRGFTDSFKLPLQTIRPNNQYQWPNPYPPRRITALGHTDRARPGAIPAAAAPVSARFWPNPVLPKVRRQDYSYRPFLQFQEVAPLQPIAGQKLIIEWRGFQTTGPNIVLPLTPPVIVPPEVAPPKPPKRHHQQVGSARARSAVTTGSGAQQVRTSSSRSTIDTGTGKASVKTGSTKTDAQDP